MATPAQFVALTGGGAAVAAPFVPTDISGLVAWYDFSIATANLWQDTARTSVITTDAQPIKGVTDKSGLVRHLSQPTTGSAPVYKTGILNGLSVGRFVKASGQTIVSASVAGPAQPYTVLVVYKLAALATANDILEGASFLPTIGVTAGDAYRYYAGSNQTGGTANTSTAHELTAIFNGASSSMRVDASSISTANPGAGALGATFALGATSATFNGDIGEMLIYNSALSGANLTNAEAYLKAKWGTP